MRYLYLFLSFFSICFFLSCTTKNSLSDKPELIYVSILPQKYMVEQIAGDAFIVDALLPSASSPAIYEPSPVQMKKLVQAKAYFRIGKIGFEQSWMDRIRAVNSSMKIYDQSENVKLIEASHFHGDHVRHTYDPHIWLSPKEVHIQAQNIYKYLTELKPDSAAFFKRNLKHFSTIITQTDKAIMALFENVQKKTFMVYHPSLSYFARDYQLTQIALEKEGKEPSGKYMAKLIKTSKELEINTIFIQKQFPRQKAQMLAKELNALIEVIDPLAYNWPQNILKIARSIKKSLSD